MRSIFFIILFLTAQGLFSQSENLYTSLYTNAENGPGYFSPFADVIATNLNVHHFSSPYQDKFGIGLGVIGVRALVQESQRSHRGQTAGLSPDQQPDVPTLFGESSSVFIEDQTGGLYSFPPGYEVNTITFLIPQVTISGLWNTDLSFRYMAFQIDDEFEGVNLIGGGIRHHIHPYLNGPEELRLNLGYTFNQLAADLDVLKTTIHSGFVEAGYSLSSKFSLYTNLAYLSSNMDIEYTDEEEEIFVDFSTSGDQAWKVGVGFDVYLKPLYFRGGIDFISSFAYSATIGLAF